MKPQCLPDSIDDSMLDAAKDLAKAAAAARKEFYLGSGPKSASMQQTTNAEDVHEAAT